jgi:hypothetical protein
MRFRVDCPRPRGLSVSAFAALVLFSCAQREMSKSSGTPSKAIVPTKASDARLSDAASVDIYGFALLGVWADAQADTASASSSYVDSSDEASAVSHCQERQPRLLERVAPAELVRCKADRECQISYGADPCCPCSGGRAYFSFAPRLWQTVCAGAPCPGSNGVCDPAPTLMVPVCRGNVCRALDLGIPSDCPVPPQFKGLHERGLIWK